MNHTIPAASRPARAAYLAGRLARRMLHELTRGNSVAWMGDAADTFHWLGELHPSNAVYRRHIAGLRETIEEWLDTPANLNHYNYDAMIAALYTGSGV